MARKKPNNGNFNHSFARVRSIEDYTAKHKKSAPQNIPADIVAARLIDGIIVNSHLAELCKTLKKRHPSIKFGVGYDCAKNFNGHAEVWAYFPGHEYAVLNLGYSDYHQSNNELIFRVVSRTLPALQRLTRSLATAIDVANKNIRPYTAAEIAKIGIYNTERELRPLAQIASSITTAQEAIGLRYMTDTNLAVFVSEFRNMLSPASGYNFVNPYLKDKFVALVQARDRYNEVTKMHKKLFFVHIFNGFATCLSATLRPSKDLSLDGGMGEPVSANYPVDKLPHRISSRIAALDMVEEDEYVEGVGLRASDGGYWIERDIEEELRELTAQSSKEESNG